MLNRDHRTNSPRRRLGLVTLGLLGLLGCKSNAGGADGSSPPASATSTAAAAAAEPAKKPEAEPAKEGAEAPKEGTFGTLVEDAEWVKIAIVHMNGSPTGGDKPVRMDDDWIEKLVAAVGADTKATDAVPKCLPTYSLSFGKEQGIAVASLRGVCADDSPVVFVHEEQAYVAADSEAARALLAEVKPGATK